MNQAQQERLFEKAARNVARAMLTNDRRRELATSANLEHLRSRLSTFAILLDSEIKRFEESPGRSEALALILTADFCWQTLRRLADRSKPKDDLRWIDMALPTDWKEADQDTGNGYFCRQREIVNNAKWVFELHSAMRHPEKESLDLIALLRDPVCRETGDRLLIAASGIRKVWLSMQCKIDPLVSFGR